LEMVSSWRLVGGFHGVLVSSRAFFLPPMCSLQLSGVLGDEVDDAQYDSWRGWFGMSPLGD
jgi:hypothetical protein